MGLTAGYFVIVDCCCLKCFDSAVRQTGSFVAEKSLGLETVVVL